MSVVALSSGALGGTLLGLFASYAGGKLDVLIIIVVLGTGSMTNVVLAVALTVWARFARLTSLQVGQVILLEASRSFLGLGLPPGPPAWGIMVTEGRAVIVSAWWLSLSPGVAITAVVLACNFLGDWLRETLDPTFRSA